MTFHDLDLIPQLLKAVEKAGYETPSPIQQKAIRPVLAGHDLLGCAQTGTGKTAAFALPILQRLAAARPAKRQVRALILTPTRELALQIDESFAEYGRYLPLRHAVIFGGVGQGPQVAALQHGVDILVACPGRLNDLIGQGFVELSGVEIFVLDEADRMLDMGFVQDVKKVIRQLPQKRQTLMFSATMPAEIEQLAESILHDPVEVKVDPVSSTVDKIEQSLYYVSKADKPALLAKLVGQPQVKNALIFSRTKHGADKIARGLNKEGIPAAAIHGNKSQNARVAALESFKAGKVKALVATDIAARGIDISELSHVFNYDLPEVAETYVHRIGRTARAGQSGYAVSFCTPEEQEYLAGIEKLNRKKIPVAGGRPVSAAEARQAAAELARAKAEAIQARVAARRGGTPAARPGQQAAVQAAAPGQGGKAAKNGEKPRPGRGVQAAETPAAKTAAPSPKAAPKPAARPAASAEPAEPYRGPKPFWMPSGQEQRKEETDVQKDRSATGEGLSASAKRRRRRRRAAADTPPPAQETRAPAPDKAPKPAARPAASREDRAARQNAPRAPQPARQSAQQPAKQAAQQSPQQGRQRTQERAAKPAKAPQPRRPAPEDPGLLLIARKPPQQKFTSFEEYMKSHGGVTEPVSDPEDPED